MRLAGRVFKAGKHWAIEVPILAVTTQGRTKKEAFEMIRDALESLVNKPEFVVSVYQGKGPYFEVGASDVPALTAFLLRRQRQKHGLTLSEVSNRLGSKSLNGYARYEQGRSVPSVEKLGRLLAALSPGNDFVLLESRRDAEA